ncbi:MAG TPA: 2'-5' RNA ligase family protein [Methylomirabilota bacterium]|nr:2'-5' RNA ligase family protein [Methylomirabilota bacterium]
MSFAIELALDARSAASVRTLWRRLAEAGMRFMADSGADPHVSLVIWDGLDVDRASTDIVSLAAETAPLPVSFTHVSAFGAEVVYLALAPSKRLVELQARVDARLAPLGRARWPHYAPAAWVPHCTLAMELGSVSAVAALALASELTLPLVAHLDCVAIVEFRPVRERFSRPLTGGAGGPRP